MAMNIHIYVTKDNKEFKDKQQAIRYEERLVAQEKFAQKYQLKKIDLDCYYNAIFIKELDVETKKELCKHFQNLHVDAKKKFKN